MLMCGGPLENKMKKLLLAGIAALFGFSVPHIALAQTAVVVSGTTCPSTAIMAVGPNQPLLETQAGALCTNASGGGGGGGAVTAAAGSFADGALVTEGALADTACATDNGTCSLEALIKRLNQRLTTLNTTLGSPFQAGGSIANTTFGVTGTFWQATQPVSIASMPSTPVTGTFWQATQPVSISGNQATNEAQINGVTPLMGNGVSGTGSQRVNIASDNTAFPVNAQPTPVTSGGLSTCFLVAVASSNSTNCKASAGQVYHIHVFNNSATVAYLHLINSSSAPTCSSATTVDQIMVPANGGVEDDYAMGEAFSTGISFCFSGGIAANDNTSVAASTYTIAVGYK